jgi:hypothetical protein
MRRQVGQGDFVPLAQHHGIYQEALMTRGTGRGAHLGGGDTPYGSR